MRGLILILITVWCTVGLHGCQSWHRATPSSPAPRHIEPTPQVQAAKPQRQTREPVKQAPTADPQTQGDGKLLETELYVLYGKPGYRGSWCFENYAASVRQVFKVDADFVITNDPTYTERFEREILPILKARCTSLSRVDVHHYIKGVRIDQSMKEDTVSESVLWAGEPLSMMTIMITSQGTLTYTMFREESLAALRAKREPPPQELAKRNRWKKRVEEFAAQQRAAEEAAEQKLAAASTTADGQLSVSGIDNEHKKLFLMIYDGEYVALSKRTDFQDLPIILYRSAMAIYDKGCHAFFKDRIKVVESVEVFHHREGNPFGGPMTNVYKDYVSTSYMERRYEQVFRSTYAKDMATVLKNSRKNLAERTTPAGLWDNVLDQGKIIMEGAFKEKERLEKAMGSLKVLLSPNACGKPGIVRFMDNYNRYIGHDYPSEVSKVEVYAQPINGTYPYTEKIQTAYIERYYVNVPPTFSPDFPVPTDGEEIAVYLNKGSERPGLKWVRVSSLALRELTPDHTYTQIQLPPDVKQAMKEDKYFVVQCTYVDGKGGGPVRYYWNANGPLPSDAVQAFAKTNNILEPRRSCPTSPQ